MRTHGPLQRPLLRIGISLVAMMGSFALASAAQGAATTTTLSTGTGATITRLPLTTGVTGGEETAIWCTAPGSCVAGGTETSGLTGQHAVLSTEANGVWSKPQIVGTGVIPLSASDTMEHVICPRKGSCVALGQVITNTTSSSGAHFSSFLVVQHGTRWDRAQLVPTTGLGPKASYILTGMACPSVGSCVITGVLLKNGTASRVFSLTWHAAKWSRPLFLSAAALGPRATLMSSGALSCVGSWCEAVGLYTTVRSAAAQTGRNSGAFVATYSGGQWHDLHALSAYRASTSISLFESISCTGVGACVAGGQSDPLKSSGSTAIAAEEHHGRWSAPYALSSPGASVLETISCVDVPACAGVITKVSGGFSGVVTMSASGHWRLSTSPSAPGWTSLQGWAMSCVARSCTIVGSGTQGSTGAPVPLVITPRAG